ncbi:Trimeric GatFAB AmidoTransferase(AdT) complex subunit [Trapelia coarctata]|nr:Trimeric GatFAB AmidoTransferase(AdT) complex subunit [Trapelia coarctata]
MTRWLQRVKPPLKREFSHRAPTTELHMSLWRHAENCLKSQKIWKELNAFVPHGRGDESFLKVIKEAESHNHDRTTNPVHGRLIAIKDNICTADFPTTCASHILEGFQSPYNSHVVQRLEDVGAVIAGKTNLDEFGMGSHSTQSAFGPVLNPLSIEESSITAELSSAQSYSAGGSSGGSAVAVQTGQCWAALGTDTGGSVRLPAAYTGIFGFKPSYGLISRHGVIAYANSLDTVGILARNSVIVKQVFDQIRGHHALDPSSMSPTTLERIDTAAKSCSKSKSLRIGIPREYNIAELHPIVRGTWLNAFRLLSELGHAIYPVSLPSTKLALSAYYVIAPAEASSNLAKYDGVRYGNQAAQKESQQNVLYSNTRGEGFGKEVRKRILLGAYSLSASAIDNYFIKAQTVRRLVQRDFDSIFARQNPLLEAQHKNTDTEGVDVLLTPTTPSTAPTLDSLSERSSVDTYRDDVLTVPASLAGLPAMNIPIGTKVMNPDGSNGPMPVGIQIIAQYGDDDMVFKAAQALEEIVWTGDRWAHTG